MGVRNLDRESYCQNLIDQPLGASTNRNDHSQADAVCGEDAGTQARVWGVLAILPLIRPTSEHFKYVGTQYAVATSDNIAAERLHYCGADARWSRRRRGKETARRRAVTKQCCKSAALLQSFSASRL